MKFTFRDIVWCAVFALVLIILSKCHRDKTNSLNASVTELIEQSKATDSAHSIESMQKENKLNILLGQLQNATAKQQVADKQLTQSFATITRLAGAVKVSKFLTDIDTNLVAVGPDYVMYCDSLAMTSEATGVEFIEFKKRTASLLQTKDTAMQLQANMLNSERAYSAACKKDFSALQHYYAESEKNNKPHNQLYVGAELLGNQATVIQNVGAVLSLKTKGDKLWQISGGLQNGGGYYGRINGNILIRLRKN